MDLYLLAILTGMLSVATATAAGLLWCICKDTAATLAWCRSMDRIN